MQDNGNKAITKSLSTKKEFYTVNSDKLTSCLDETNFYVIRDKLHLDLLFMQIANRVLIKGAYDKA